MSEIYEIYHLSDPRDQSIRYVGMSKDAKRRLQRHLSQKDSPLMPWFQELAETRLKPILTIIETVQDKQQAKEREAYWIKYHAEQGAHLENYQGNADARSAWKERESWLAYLTKEYSFIEDPQEREYVIAVFLELYLHRNPYWTEIACVMAKIFRIDIEQRGSEAV